jgi:predicted metal-binding protein
MIPEKVDQVGLKKTDESLLSNLEKYAAQAIDMGATAAQPVRAEEIPVDPRVSLKCSIPKCFGYGTSAHCPPYSMKAEETAAIIEKYRMTLVLSLETPSPVIVRDKATIKERVEAYKKIFEMVSKIESSAFYDGYYLSVGFAAGSCKSTFCYNVPCSVLQNEKCRLSLRARPSMEAVGIDCYKLATSLGWEIYPIGSGACADCIPHGLLMGLILVD